MSLQQQVLSKTAATSKIDIDTGERASEALVTNFHCGQKLEKAQLFSNHVVFLLKLQILLLVYP